MPPDWTPTRPCTCSPRLHAPTPYYALRRIHATGHCRSLCITLFCVVLPRTHVAVTYPYAVETWTLSSIFTHRYRPLSHSYRNGFICRYYSHLHSTVQQTVQAMYMCSVSTLRVGRRALGPES